MQPARKLSLALLAVVLAFSAQAAVADAGTTTLNPGQESQVAAFALKGRDVVQYTYSTGLDTVFRVKASGTEVFNATGQAVHGSFTAPSDGTYAFSFYNGGSYMTGVSWSITPPAGTSNLLLIGGAAAGIIGASALGIGLWARGRKRSPGPPTPPQP